jgi:L-ascorbate metabolism protein UlaG (beta-lactamase superfamily)
MKIHHLRSATFVIESKDKFILIDPMLSDKGKLAPFSYFKHKLQKNPLVDLPTNSKDVLSKVTHCLLTHSQKWGIEFLSHIDHLDKTGINFLQKNNIPVATLERDSFYLEKRDINVVTKLKFWEENSFANYKIIAIPAKHGHSWMHNFMANGAGFYLQLPDEPSIYISGDTVLTNDVKKALKELNPDITVVAAGNASLDVGGDILMPLSEILEFIKLSPNKVIANHLEALNHCPITREQLKNELIKNYLLEKVYIPQDGEILEIAL